MVPTDAMNSQEKKKMGRYKLLFAIIMMALIGQSAVSAAERKLVKAAPAGIKSAAQRVDGSELALLERIEVSIPAGQSKNFNRKVTGGTIFSYECTYNCPSFMTFEDLDVYRDDLNRVNVEFSISVAADAPIGIYNVDISYYFYDVNGEYVKDVLYEYAVNTVIPAVNHPPVLSSPNLTPVEGLYSSATTFHFSVIYTDEDGDAPTDIRVAIGNKSTGYYMWIFMTAGSGDYKTGKEFYADLTGNSFGVGEKIHQYYAYDGKDPVYLPASGDFEGPIASYMFADFSASPLSGSAPLDVQFTDQSIGSVSSYLWDFGDGTTSTVKNPSHQYATVGSYSVSLKVSYGSYSNTEIKNNLIIVTEAPKPTADFTASPLTGNTPLSVQFTSRTSGTITNYYWEFGDGETSGKTNPTHIYSSQGTWTVTLTVTGPGGTATKTRSNYITTQIPEPTADFTATPTSGTTPLAVQFTSKTTGTVTSYSWNFGDGATSSQTNPSHTYTSAGAWTVTLTITGPGGSASKTRPNYITTLDPIPVPTADFTAAPIIGTTPLAVQFTNQTTGSITSYAWNFGDGTTSTQANPSHTYTTAGSWTVTLTVTGPGGTANKTKSNYITTQVPAPAVDFTATPTSGTTPLAVQFTSQTTGSVTSYAWNFGDGTTSTQANPSHTYTNAGSWTVTLTVAGPGGTATKTSDNYISTEAPVHYIRTNQWVSFYGQNSSFQKTPLVVGSIIEAYDPQGTLCGHCTVSRAGQYGFISVYRDDPLTLEVDEGAVPGDTIRFTIDGSDAVVFKGQCVWTEQGDIIQAELMTNRLPSVLIKLADFVIDEDSELFMAADLSQLFIDADADTLIYAVQTDTTRIEAHVTADNHLAVRPSGDANGLVTLFITASDGYASASDTVEVMITPVNDPPVIRSMPDTTFINTMTLSLDLNRFGTDVEEKPEELRWIAVVQPDKSDSVKCIIDENNLATIRSAHSFTGTLWMIFTVQDSCKAADADTINVFVDLVVRVEPSLVPALPTQYSLGPNYPNPFNPETAIRFGLPHDSHVELVIYNLKGQQVCSLANGLFKAGWYDRRWNGLDASGEQASSGIYLVRMTAAGTVRLQKISLVR